MAKSNIMNGMLQIWIGAIIAVGFIGMQKVNAVQITLDVSPQNLTNNNILFDNGSPNLASGREVTQWVQAEDFTLNQNSTLGNVKFWTLESVDAFWDGTIKYFLFNSENDKPDKITFAMGTGVEIKKEATGRTLYDSYKEFTYSFDLENPVNLSANTKYWLGLHLSESFDRNNIYWETTNIGFGVNGMSAYLGNFNEWSRSSEGVERAFELNAKSSGDSQPVPEPSIMLSSFVTIGIGTALRRKFIKKN
jgi:hypothetical protein